MDFVFVVDPLTGLQPGHDSSVALMEAAQHRGHRVLTTTAGELSWVEGRAMASCRAVQLRPAVLHEGHWLTDTDWFTVADEEEYELNRAAAVFMRTDPPVDADYWRATYLLGQIDPASTLLVNDPDGLRHANEKLFALEFPELTPPTIVTASRDLIRRQVAVWGRAVLKPTDVMGGRGIFVLDARDPNLNSIVDTGTAQGCSQVVVQQWIPQVDQTGDRRVIVLDGEPIGALLRMADGGDFRCNMATGGAVHASRVTSRDREICAALAPALRRHGLRFVGLDVIGDLITEINVTSPTGIREIDALSGTNLGDQIVTWAEKAAPQSTSSDRESVVREAR